MNWERWGDLLLRKVTMSSLKGSGHPYFFIIVHIPSLNKALAFHLAWILLRLIQAQVEHLLFEIFGNEHGVDFGLFQISQPGSYFEIFSNIFIAQTTQHMVITLSNKWRCYCNDSWQQTNVLHHWCCRVADCVPTQSPLTRHLKPTVVVGRYFYTEGVDAAGGSPTHFGR